MSDILDVLHARCAEVAGNAILTGEKHPSLTLSTHEVADLLNHIANVHRRYRDLNHTHHVTDRRANQLQVAATDAVESFQRIRSTLDHPTAHPDAQARQCSTIAHVAAEKLTAATLHTEGATK